MRDKTIYNAFARQSFITARDLLKTCKWNRRERRELLGIIWPRRWWVYGMLVAVGFLAGVMVRFWHDWSFAFQCGKLVGGLE